MGSIKKCRHQVLVAAELFLFRGVQRAADGLFPCPAGGQHLLDAAYLFIVSHLVSSARL